MKILSRYFLKETIFPFFVALSLISFMLIMNKVITLVDLVLAHGVGLGVVMRLVAYILPSTFAITIPMSLLVAAMLALGRLSADMELVAMKAGAVSLVRLFVPLVALGLAFSLGMLIFNEMLLPKANQGYKTLFYDIVSQRSSLAIQENTYVSDFENLIIRVGSKDPDGDRLQDITVIKLPTDKEPLQWIQADHGRMVSDKANLRIYMVLNDGTVQFLGAQGFDQLTTLFFKSSTVDLDIGGTLKQVQDKDRQPQEMTIREIWQALASMPEADQRRFHFAVEMHKKIAIPFACLCFLLIGFPLGILVRKGGRLLGFVFAIGLIFVYYLFLSAGQTYGDEGRITPWVSMWLANFVLAGVGLPLSWAALNEKRFFHLSLR
jgi:lipopolysaccharide export system permease protein